MQRVSRTVRKRAWMLLAMLPVLVLLLARHSILSRWGLSRLGDSIISSEAPQPADLILVLGGDFFGPRVLKAAELGAQGYAPLVLISSPPYQGRPEGEFAIRLLESKGYPKEMFAVAPHSASSTREEAVAIRDELRLRHANRVILVTAAYHSRRASIVFKRTCPDVQFISVPASDPHYLPESWWDDASSRRIFVTEWSKIIGTVLLPTLR